MTAGVRESNLFQGLYPKGFKPYQIKKFDIVIAILLFVLTSIAYIKNLTPSVTAGDSGELTTAVYNMGACHPPGFPLYGIVGKLFTFIPVGDIGYRVNLFSAISAAGAILIFYLILLKLLGLNRDKGRISLDVHLPAVAGSIAFAFTRTMWSQAVIGEVYALNTFLIAFLVYVMLIWYEEIVNFRNDKNPHFADRLTLLLAFVMGLSLTNHQLPLWYIVGFVLFLVPIVMLIVSAQHSPQMDAYFEGKTGGIFSPMNIVIVGGILFLLLCILILPIFSGTFIMIGIAAYLLAIFSLFTRVYDDRKSEFAQQIRDRLWVILMVLAVVILAGVLFVLKAYTSPMIYPKDMIWVWIAIFIIPVTLTAYTIHVHVSGRKEENNWIDKLLYLLSIGFWLLIVAMTVYLYMRVRAMSLAGLAEPKPLSWGDTRSFDVLFNHMLRKQYGRPGGNLNNFWGQLKAVAKITTQQVHWINIIVGVIGLVYMFFREKVWAFFTLMTAALFTVIMIKFVNFEVDPRTLSFQEVMYIQSFMFLVIYMSFAYQLLIDAVGLLKERRLKAKAG